MRNLGLDERVRLSNLFPVELERKKKKKGVFLHGMVSTKDLDLAGDIVLPNAFEKHLHLYKANPLYFLNHWLEIPIGKVNDIEITPDGLYLREIELDDDDPFVAEVILPKVEKGMLTKQSIGFIPVKSHYDTELKARVFDEVILFDTSLVSIPANFNTWVMPLKALNMDNDSIVKAYWNFIQNAFKDSEIVQEAVAKGIDFSSRRISVDLPGLEEIVEKKLVVQRSNKSYLVGLPVDFESSWSFDADDGNALIEKGEMELFAKVHLAREEGGDPENKGTYKYPVAKIKGGDVTLFWRGLMAAKQRGAQQGEDDVVAFADSIAKEVEKKREKDLMDVIEEFKQNQSLETQSVICSKERFKTKEEAAEWVRKHGFRDDKVDETSTSYRFRQFPPSHCIEESFVTKEITDGVSLVLCKKKEGKSVIKDFHESEAFDVLDRRIRGAFGEFDFSQATPYFTEITSEERYTLPSGDMAHRVMAHAFLEYVLSGDISSVPPVEELKFLDTSSAIVESNIEFENRKAASGEKVYLLFKNGIPLLPVGYRGENGKTVPDFKDLSLSLIKVLGGRGGIVLTPETKKRLVDVIAKGYSVCGKKLPTKDEIEISDICSKVLFSLNYRDFVWYNDELKVFEEEILLRDLDSVLNILRKRDLSSFGEGVQKKATFLYKLLGEGVGNVSSGKLSVSIRELLQAKEEKNG